MVLTTMFAVSMLKKTSVRMTGDSAVSVSVCRLWRVSFVRSVQLRLVKVS